MPRGPPGAGKETFIRTGPFSALAYMVKLREGSRENRESLARRRTMLFFSLCEAIVAVVMDAITSKVKQLFGGKNDRN